MYPFTVLAQEHVSTFESSLYFQFDSDLAFLQKIIEDFKPEFTDFLIKLRVNYTREEKREFEKMLKKDASHTANCDLNINQGSIKGYAVKVHCLSVVRDFTAIHTFINEYFLRNLSSKRLSL